VSPQAPREGSPLRSVVADGSFLVREAITSILRSAPGFEVAAACRDLPSLLSAVASTAPDVVVTEVALAPAWTDEGIRAAAELRVSHPDVGVVILGERFEPPHILGLLRLGSGGRACLVKARLHHREDLLDAVRAVADGGSVIDPKAVETLVASRSRPCAGSMAQLSPRERQILSELAKGKGNAAIADTLELSKRSVEKHIHSIFSKLDLGDSEEVSRRVKAALIFLAEDPQARPAGPFTRIE
jgi:DNA-binding NarL/FixJ family response regulator